MRETFHRFFAYFRVEHALVLVPVFGFAVYDSVFSAFSSVLAVLWEMYPDVSRAGIQMVHRAFHREILAQGDVFQHDMPSFLHRRIS